MQDLTPFSHIDNIDSSSSALIAGAAWGGEFSVLSSSDLPPDIASGYAGPARAIADPAARAIIDYNLGPRSMGVAGMLISGYGVAGSVMTGNVPGMALSLDQMYANALTVATGEITPTFANQGLRALGATPGQAALGEMGLGLATLGPSAWSVNSIVNQESRAYSYSRSTYSANPVSNFSYTVKQLPDDLIADSRGVYGYLPTEGSEFSPGKWPVDWTNPQQVAAARATRLEYHQGLADEKVWVTSMRNQGISDMKIAEQLVEMRNQARMSHYSEADLPILYERNMTKFQNPYGPSFQTRLDQLGSPQAVIESGTRSNTTMDILTGIGKLK